MKEDSNDSVDFDDQQAVLAFAVHSFEDAVHNATEENDSLGIPSPVGVKGQVVWVRASANRGEALESILDENPPSPDSP